MRDLLRKTGSVLWSGLVAFVIVFLGQGVWGTLAFANLRVSPAIPWSVPVMALLLWLLWKYLGGKGWPSRTAVARRRLLRFQRISAPVLAWSMVAGALSITALAGYWIVMFELVKMPGNLIPDYSQYPPLTLVLMLIMGILAAPFSEEPAFRGYCQGILERRFSPPAALVLSSIWFALAHVTQGFLLPKLFVYFLAGLVFGAIAHLAGSITASVPVHMLADLTFFTLVWPLDSARRLVWEGGDQTWFWTHVAQALVFTALAFLAFRRLGRAAGSTTPARDLPLAVKKTSVELP